jgi:hypothetical protein
MNPTLKGWACIDEYNASHDYHKLKGEKMQKQTTTTQQLESPEDASLVFSSDTNCHYWLHTNKKEVQK